MNPVLHSPPKITVGVTEGCPLRCRHCYADCANAPKPGELDARQWIALLRALSDQGVIQVYFEGGEPLIKPGMLDILRTCSPTMMTKLRTHGWGLDDTLATALAAAGLGRALVDLAGANAATHDAATGVAGSFQQSCDAIAALTRVGIPVDVLVVLTRQTAPELLVMAELVAALGAARLGILRLYPMGRARQAWPELALSLQEQMAAIAAVQSSAGLGIMQSWHPKDRNCCWQAAAINAFGRAIGCMYLREYVDFGDATQTPYGEIFRTNEHYRALRDGPIEQGCDDCTAPQGRPGGCRSTAYAWHGRWSAPDPFDITLNHGIDLRTIPPTRLDA